MKNKEMISQFLQSEFDVTYEPDETDVVIDFSGPFTIQNISELAQRIKFFDFNRSSVRSKILKCFIELAQNVSYYSVDREFLNRKHNVGVGDLFLLNNNENVFLISSNKIFNRHCVRIKEYFNELSGLNIEQIRSLKKNVLKKSDNSSESAHIGLIYLSLISNKKIKYKFVKIDDLFSEIIFLVEF